MYAHRPRPLRYERTGSLCPGVLQVKESFYAPEDRKLCVVMTLSEDYPPHLSAWGPILTFNSVFAIFWAYH